MQQKLLRIMLNAEAVEARCRVLIEGAKLLGIPVSATEQYPRGLGETVPSLAEKLVERTAKMRFSALESLPWADHDRNEGRHQVVVIGIEAHVCILQTALDLVAAGFDVHVPVDAVTGRKELDIETAYRRMSGEGVTLTTSEAVLFEWCETAEAAEFKAISKLVISGA
jgi:nicotinamidase-related amidase